MTKRNRGNDIEESLRQMDKGAAEARSLKGPILGGGFDTYAGIGRAAHPEKRPYQGDDEDVEPEDDLASDDDEDDTEAKKQAEEEDSKRGARTARNLLGKNARGAPMRQWDGIKEQRRTDNRAHEQRVDDALGRLHGEAMARRLLGKR